MTKDYREYKGTQGNTRLQGMRKSKPQLIQLTQLAQLDSNILNFKILKVMWLCIWLCISCYTCRFIVSPFIVINIETFFYLETF
ncbi:hypothetical protein RIR_jg23502.t1 [Rhizophagus irregularis DAOM 181602=DAOM 197198]|nr:hypothetical protein RIR_jg23502.t1 [Rhizophagus irregularis DAOM 181602=DAOM 197198]